MEGVRPLISISCKSIFCNPMICKFHALTTGDLAKTLFGVVQEFDGRDDFGIETSLAGFHARQSEQVFGETRHAGGVFADDFEKFASGTGVVGTVEKSLGVSLDRSQGRAEFVGNVGDKIAAGFFDALSLGEVAQHGDGAAVGQGSGRNVEGAAVDDRRSAGRLYLFRSGGGFNGGEEIGVTDGFDDRGIQAGALRDKAVHGLVGPLHEAVAAHGDDCVLHAVEQSFELMLAGTHAGKAAFDLAGGFVDGSGHAADFVERLVLDAGLEVSLLDADGDIDDALQAAGSPDRDEGGDQQSDEKRDS